MTRAINPKLLAFCGVLAVGAAIGGVQYGLDYLNGGIERVTTPEATACLAQSGASNVQTETNINLTNQRGGDLLQGVLPNGTSDGVVLGAVVSGGKNAPTSGWTDADPTTRINTIANAVVSWREPAPAGLATLVECLREEQEDA